MDGSGFVDDWQSGKSLIDCNLHMLTSEDSYDVTFLVGENESMVRAHRYVLMSRSCVFHTMLRGPLAERGEVRLPDVTELIFRDFLRFLYTDVVDVTPVNVTGLFYLGKKYAVGSLEKVCLANLKSSLSADSACTILEQAHRFDEEDLMSKALDLIVENSEICLKTQEFAELCNVCVGKVIQSGKVTAGPELVFNAALAWASEECKRRKWEINAQNERKALRDSIFHIGFPSMDAKTFSKVVVPTKILSDEEQIKIFCYLSSQETDVAPFKPRRMPIDRNNVFFYKDKVQAATDTKMVECVQISCDHDILIKGFLVHRSKHPLTHYYQLFRSETIYGSKLVQINNVLLIDNICVYEITFQQHLTLKASIKYWFEITAKINNKISPAHVVGSELKTPIQVRVGKEKISIYVNHSYGTAGLISGLVLAVP